jgi:hypothetical protein
MKLKRESGFELKVVKKCGHSGTYPKLAYL